MPFRITRNDITKVAADVIVITANPEPVIGGETEEAVYEAAGREQLLNERVRIGRIRRGDAAFTRAYDLPADYIIHTAGPVWEGGSHGEKEILRSCYEESLFLAGDLGCGSIAFPLLAAGSGGFPKDEALQIAVSVFSTFLMRYDMDITLVVSDKQEYVLSDKVFDGVETYINDHYVEGKNRTESASAPYPSEEYSPAEYAGRNYSKRNESNRKSRLREYLERKSSEREYLDREYSREEQPEIEYYSPQKKRAGREHYSRKERLEREYYSRKEEPDREHYSREEQPDREYYSRKEQSDREHYSREEEPDREYYSRKEEPDREHYSRKEKLDREHYSRDEQSDREYSGQNQLQDELSQFLQDKDSFMEEMEFFREDMPAPGSARPPASPASHYMAAGAAEPAAEAPEQRKKRFPLFSKKKSRTLDEIMSLAGETFQEMLFRLILEKGLTNPEVYKRANLDRRLFSKIQSDPNYQPKKNTAIALALALHLNLDETLDLMSRAGYVFSPSSKPDLIIEFCIENEIYDVMKINLLLFKYDFPILV